MTNKLLIKGCEEAIRILAVSFGFITVSILWAIGIFLISEEIYWGLIPLVIGYELVRVLIKFIWKINQIWI